jgi:signal transduction histidine kinase
MIALMGEQLISDQTVGLIELVKNAYDADATEIGIELSGLHDTKTTKILLRDNGCGMTLDDIEQKWLSPAINHKEQQKKKLQRTARGRLPIGEKGVGRFAVHQLGKKLLLVSRANRAREVVIEINWDDFEREGAFLDDIDVAMSEREPEVFMGDDTGTLLIIEEAREIWTEALIAKIQRALRRLQSPHQNEKRRDFNIVFHCPDFPQRQDISSSDILNRAHYIFEGLVDENGFLDYEYRCLHPALFDRRSVIKECSLLETTSNEMRGRVPACGEFYLTFYVWDRSFLQQSNISRADLDAMAGVSVFRDKLRVLPYGEAGNDWLELDKERINAPADRISNQQIIGFVEIFQEKTPGLRDKTDRQGLIENDAFSDLRALVKASIVVFTSHWHQDRPKQERPKKKEEKHLLPEKDALNKAKAIVESAIRLNGLAETGTGSAAPAASSTAESSNAENGKAPASAPRQSCDEYGSRSAMPTPSPVQPPAAAASQISQPVDARTEPADGASNEQFATNSQRAPSADLTDSAPTLDILPASRPGSEGSASNVRSSPGLALNELLDLLNDAARYQEMNDEDFEQQRQMLVHLTATGMAAERVAHEFGRQVSTALIILQNLRSLSRGNEVALQAVSSLSACIETLRHEFRALIPYEADFRLQRTRPLRILEPIQQAITFNRQALDTSAIVLEIQGEDFAVAGRPASLFQVFDNLINNACIWLENQTTARLCVILDANARTVILEDNGPGIPEHMGESIFQPFVSMRNGGRGLGLYIVQENLHAIRAQIELDRAYTSGARFIIRFPGSLAQTLQK